MNKRLFQILDEMNVADGENKTTHVSVCTSFISADKVKAGIKISMGAPDKMLFKLMNDEVIPVLLLIDKKEYERVKNPK